MSPVGAICFALVSMGLVMAPRILSKQSSLLLGLNGSVVAAVGMATGMGFVLRSSDVFGWGDLTRVALNTAVGFSVLGFGMLALAWHPETDTDGGTPRWLPISVTLGVVTGAVGLWEGHKVNQLVARHLLEKRGYSVVVANNGREALAILDEGFSCVLMDVQMPEMDGFQCTAIIRDREQMTGSRLPIIAMTAHAMKGDDARCLAAGMDAYLSKPIQPDELFELIERHLGVSNVPASSGSLRTA
jgi:CheY-like chemotaxis protein